MRITSYHLLLCIPLLFTACSDTGNEPAPDKDGFSSLTVSPMSGRPGDLILFIGSSPFSANARASFNGVPCEPESSHAGVLYVRVPWGAKSGPVSVIIPGGTTTGPSFTVIPPCADSMCLVPFSGKPVTRSSSLHYDPMYPQADSIPWVMKISADTLTLTQEYTVGDDSRWIMSVRFRFTSILTFPLSAEGILVRREIDGVFTEALKGQVAIQDWNNGGVISGRMSFVRPRLAWWYDRDFWVRLSTR
jgi:hypothetical protein